MSNLTKTKEARTIASMLRAAQKRTKLARAHLGEAMIDVRNVGKELNQRYPAEDEIARAIESATRALTNIETLLARAEK